MGTEDSSYMLKVCPGACLLLGSGDVAPLHNSAHYFPDAILDRDLVCAGDSEGAHCRLNGHSASELIKPGGRPAFSLRCQ